MEGTEVVVISCEDDSFASSTERLDPIASIGFPELIKFQCRASSHRDSTSDVRPNYGGKRTN